MGIFCSKSVRVSRNKAVPKVYVPSLYEKTNDNIRNAREKTERTMEKHEVLRAIKDVVPKSAINIYNVVAGVLKPRKSDADILVDGVHKIRPISR